MLRLMSVTPGVMLSRPQPESAWAASEPTVANTARAGAASLLRIIVNLCLTAPAAGLPRLRNLKKYLPCCFPSAVRQKSRPGGRLTGSPDQALQPQRQSPPFFFREEAPQLALAAVRLDDEPARV